MSVPYLKGKRDVPMTIKSSEVSKHWGQDFTSASEILSRSRGIYETIHLKRKFWGFLKTKLLALNVPS